MIVAFGFDARMHDVAGNWTSGPRLSYGHGCSSRNFLLGAYIIVDEHVRGVNRRAEVTRANCLEFLVAVAASTMKLRRGTV